MPEKENPAAMENRWLKVLLGLCLSVIGLFSQQTYSAVTKSLDTLEDVSRDVMLLKAREQVPATQFYQLDARVRTLEMRDRQRKP